MRALLALSCLLLLSAPLRAQPVPEACTGPASTVLAPPPAGAPGAEARAVWLDATRLRWPGQPDEGRLRLHHAAGQIAVVDGRVVGADGAITLEPVRGALAPAVEAAFRWVGPGREARLPAVERQGLAAWLRGDLLLTREDDSGRVLAHTRLQHAAALDALYAAAESAPELGVAVDRRGAGWRVWAPTARRVDLCLHGPAPRVLNMSREARTGLWTARAEGVRDGFYTYLVEVHVPGHGWVRNRVTDPYSIGLNADSQASWIGRLDDPRTVPSGWGASHTPDRVRHMTDLVIYELHVRDFSRDDASVRPAWRGKYLGFTETDSAGMRHLRALSQAGVTDVHLLPVFDLATVPETGCVAPAIPAAAPDSEAQQAAVAAVKDRDCYNWGYDPWHYTAPEGSFATDPDDAPGRLREFRQMVMALHAAGLRVGMDVVYNHTSAAGQDPKSVLDRLVPGYYHRRDAAGAIERSTCCDNTATEHRMMARLMTDSVLTWATAHRIDSFRFDLMGHQPKAAMQVLQRRLKQATGREIHLIGEGWNFGEVADGRRFVQAAQRELAGSGIATFSDRARDAVRGGSAGDNGRAQVERKGYVNGGADGPTADLVRVGLAGTLRGHRLVSHDGRSVTLAQIPYGGGAAGYVDQPGEVVNYVENHDNQTLYDLLAFKLPQDTPADERARVQLLALAINTFSQGVAYFHAGGELLRSKSMDRNSYDSGDWFNRVDWTAQDNFFGTGLPPAWDNRESWPLMAPRLADARLRPAPEHIAFTRDAFLDLLRIRAGTPLLRLTRADDIAKRLHLPPTTAPHTLLAGHLDGRGLAGAGFADLVYLVNVDTEPREMELPALRGRALQLHPVHRAPEAADRRAREATFDVVSGRFRVPPRTAVVFVAP